MPTPQGYIIFIHQPLPSRRCINYKYSTLLHGITINIAPKVGIFPEAEGRVKYSLLRCNIINIPQGRVEY